MKLLIDGRPALGGVERLTRTLVSGLRRTLPADDLVVFGDHGREVALRRLPLWRRAARAIGGPASHILKDQLALPAAARGHRVDLFHSPSCHVLPRRMGVPGVVTLHDLSLVDHFATKRRSLISRYERAAFLGAASRAAHIITISDTVRRELKARLAVDSDRITTIYPEVPRLGRLPAPDRIPPQAGGAFLLTVGTIEPRKNLDRLLDAHEMVWRELRIPLLLVGVYGWSQRGLLRRVAASDGRVRWLGFVDDPLLAELYRRAAAVVQYSSYEGFNLPLAEALECGSPVVVSDIPVHREVAGDCAVYAPASDPPALAHAVTEVFRWPEGRRRRHREAAAARLADLRRGDPILRHIEVYRRVMEEA